MSQFRASLPILRPSECTESACSFQPALSLAPTSSTITSLALEAREVLLLSGHDAVSPD